MKTWLVTIALAITTALPALAQSDRVREWRAQLALLSTGQESLETRAMALMAMRRQLVEWISLNQSVPLKIPAAPALPWDDAQLQEQLSVVREVVARIAESDPAQPFYLGVTAVNVIAPVATLSPVSDSLDRLDIQNHQALTVNQAIEYLPGVSVDHKAPRNQTGISIGGFDTRQVPLYLDGVPAYVPFDGYVDLTRYLSADVAEVQVAKGYTSPLLGPNVLGGVVNVVTRQPQRNLEGDAQIGTAPGKQINTGVHIGSRWPRFFVQG